MQQFLNLQELPQALAGRKVMLVCGGSMDKLSIGSAVTKLAAVRFSGFSPNPLYEDVAAGVKLFLDAGCDAILAVGGGSAMDVAKCIKLFAAMDQSKLYLGQPYVENDILLAAIPTTAGTGSESTRHAVIYYGGEKQSISHPSVVPGFVCLIPEVLEGLPVYQKKCTMLDALGQAIESWWSVSATAESIEYSRKAISLIKEFWKPYIENGDHAEEILLASNYAGRAINITATTAAHAMSYKLTSLYGIPHGHAVGLCLPQVWAEMADEGKLQDIFRDFPVDLPWLCGLLNQLGMEKPVSSNRDADLEILADSVNPLRLKNNPVAFSRDTLKAMYERILSNES
ncbi:MAG: phosphonoacetaldehyde reductase [Oscillospiraceae bacterium]|nr:phosphonoacetaldehyde reductase [Oscillospiraceae bacterium]